MHASLPTQPKGKTTQCQHRTHGYLPACALTIYSFLEGKTMSTRVCAGVVTLAHYFPAVDSASFIRPTGEWEEMHTCFFLKHWQKHCLAFKKDRGSILQVRNYYIIEACSRSLLERKENMNT